MRKIDRLSSRRAYFETRRQEANAWFKRLLKRFFNAQPKKDNPMQEDYLLRQDIKGIEAWAQD